MFANTCSASTTLTAEDGRRFTLESMDMQELNGPGYVSITFTGVRGEGEGGTVTHTVQLNGTTAWETVQFPKTFRALKSVTWRQGSLVVPECQANNPHMFTRVRVHPGGSARD
jgi:hypothetical protein